MGTSHEKSAKPFIKRGLNSFYYFFATTLPVGLSIQDKSVSALFINCKKLAKRNPHEALSQAIALLPLTGTKTDQRDLAVEDVLDIAEIVAETDPERAAKALDGVDCGQMDSRRIRKLYRYMRERLWQRTKQENFIFS